MARVGSTQQVVCGLPDRDIAHDRSSALQLDFNLHCNAGTGGQPDILSYRIILYSRRGGNKIRGRSNRELVKKKPDYFSPNDFED